MLIRHLIHKQGGRMVLCFFLTVLLSLACSRSDPALKDQDSRDSLSGKLTIFHAGSLSLPIRVICDSFNRLYPRIRVMTEAAGSKACARKIMDLNRECDVFASADYQVIEQWLIPEHASWCIRFAGNEMALVYAPHSRYADKIRKDNWIQYLLKPDVAYGRSDPDSDPCGVRAVLTMNLAEKYYKMTGISSDLQNKDRHHIRPKETDLLALLESRAIDYIFLYRSVAEQHGLPFLRLPDSVNLSDPGLSDWYGTVSVTLRGKQPGELMTEKGEAMVYGITIPVRAPEPALARLFTSFFLSDGMQIIEKMGQTPLVPCVSPQWDQIPEDLRTYALKPR